MRLGSWRSVEHSQHGFFTECFIDELAHAAGKEPFEFRRGLLAHAPRHRAVLEKAAWIAGWGAAPAAGRARGIALVESFGSIVAEVAEIEIVDSRIKVHNVWAAVDCGYVVNPDTATAQIEGGIIFGLSAALFSEITIRDGRVEQANFTDYPLPKLADAPRIKVEFIHSDATPRRPRRTRRAADRARDRERGVRAHGQTTAYAAAEGLRTIEDAKER